MIHCEYVAQKPCSEKELNQRVVAKKPCCTKEEDQSPTDYFVMEEDIEKYKPLHEDQLHLTKSLLENLIIGCNLPPSIVEDQHFLQFLEDMNPKFCVPSCTYIEAELANYIHVWRQPSFMTVRLIKHLQLILSWRQVFWKKLSLNPTRELCHKLKMVVFYVWLIMHFS